MHWPTVAEIDLAAIVHNLRSLRGLTPAGTVMIAVVKADAYGHGAVPVSRALAESGAEYLAVACVGEAVELDEAGVDGRVLVMGAPVPGDAEEMVARKFECVISSLDQAEHLHATARQRHVQIGVHVKFDTGMGRVGFAAADHLEVMHALQQMESLRIEGVMTHLPSADEEDEAEFTRAQLANFGAIRGALEAAGFEVPLWHAANTAGIVGFSEAHCNAIRPGIGLYGCYPSQEMPQPVALRQAMTWKTEIARIRNMPVGDTVSYGRTWRAERPSRIALLSVGYADGYDRRLSNRGEVLVRGRRAPVVGRVCMDMTMVDVTDIPDASEGDEVVLLGAQDEDAISIGEMAALLNTIPHVVMTGIGKRVPRTYCG